MKASIFTSTGLQEVKGAAPQNRDDMLCFIRIINSDFPSTGQIIEIYS